jgi:DNA modification methylase
MEDTINFTDVLKSQSSMVKDYSGKLDILPEFEKLCCPVYLDRHAETPMGELGILPQDADERKALRYDLLKKEIEKTKTVSPFIVWKYGKKLVICDGRHDDFRVAVELNLPIQIVEFKFNSIEEARVFVAYHTLNRSHLNAAHRMMMVRQFKDMAQKLARQNQGTRNDKRSDAEKTSKKVHTTKILSALANVGEQSLRRFYKVLDDGPKCLGEEKTQECIDRILCETQSVNGAYNILKEAKNKKEQTQDFSNENPDLFSSEGSDKGKITANAKQVEATYDNPSLKEDWHNKILFADRIDALREIPDNSANLFLMSPEYNVPNISYDVSVPVLPHYEFLQRLNELWAECARIMKSGGRLIINLPSLVSTFGDNDYRSFNMPLYIDVINKINELDIGLNLREVLVWHKPMPTRRIHLSTASPSNPCYVSKHEYILIFSKHQWEMTPENENAPTDLTNDLLKDLNSSVISIAPQSRAIADHPAVYPEALCRNLIRMHSFVGDTVIDPANGSGSSTAAAASLGRRWFGCDISEKYCKAANERTLKAHKMFLESIKQETKKKVNKAA